ncbi:hypothetical protein RRG08_031092 [Elysia crispata]|uniref:Uncharacterized protein n=1 Tax=Elysia crispata TaxID=231223 RepID=A0AAE1DFT9_9GAST|nr:hypothetical protein RRG08_031092 [Elysia crispata]
MIADCGYFTGSNSFRNAGYDACTIIANALVKNSLLANRGLFGDFALGQRSRTMGLVRNQGNWAVSGRVNGQRWTAETTRYFQKMVIRSGSRRPYS